MEYKELKTEDIEKIAQMYVKAFNAPPWNDNWTIDTVQKRLKQMMSCEGAYGLVCYENDELIGMILGNYEYYYDCMQFQIKEFCLDGSMQGKGRGRLIIEEFISRLKEMGIKEIFLFTSKTQSGFYKKCGFNEIEELTMLNREI